MKLKKKEESIKIKKLGKLIKIRILTTSQLLHSNEVVGNVIFLLE